MDLAQIDASALTIVKIGMVMVLLLYVIFALIVVKQVTIMTNTLQVGFEKPIKLFSVIHFLAAVLTFFISLAVL